MMFWYGHEMGGWGSALTILVWVMVIAGVIVLVRYLVREQRTPDEPAPEQILAERFARGEIDEEDYRGRLATLHGGPRG